MTVPLRPRDWVRATVSRVHSETPNARTLAIDVPGWPGHAPGQHVDIRLTAPDGYTASRSYSIASSSASGVVEVTVDRLDDGEVSPYLVDVVVPGDQLEVRGPAGRWFVWTPDAPDAAPRPVQLVAGGSGIVPLMAMIRTHDDIHSSTPFRLLYSVRSPELAIYRTELLERASTGDSLAVHWAFTRSAPEGWAGGAARLDLSAVRRGVFPPELGAEVFVCGSTPFVEAAANWLLDLGHAHDDIRTERYGG